MKFSLQSINDSAVYIGVAGFVSAYSNSITVLGKLGGNSGFVYGVNNSGQVTVYSSAT